MTLWSATLLVGLPFKTVYHSWFQLNRDTNAIIIISPGSYYRGCISEVSNFVCEVSSFSQRHMKVRHPALDGFLKTSGIYFSYRSASCFPDN